MNALSLAAALLAALLLGCSNGGTCIEIACDAGTQCTSNNGGCPSQATCTETNNVVSCSCGMGFAVDGGTCADVDECLTNNGGCGSNATCANTTGSRECTCSGGFVRYLESCRPLPTVTALSRIAVPPRYPELSITLTGTNFAPNGFVTLDGMMVASTVNGATSATTTIPAQSLLTERTIQVAFVNPDPGGGPSNALTFSVNREFLVETPASAVSPLAVIALDSTDIYFAAADAGASTAQVMKVSMTAGPVTVLASGQRSVTGLFVGANGVYWCHSGDAQLSTGFVRSVGLNGGAVTSMATEPNGLHGMTIDTTDAYYLDRANNLKKVGLGASTPMVIGTGPGAPLTSTLIASDATRLYYGQSYPPPLGLWTGLKSGGNPTAYPGVAGWRVALDATDLFYLSWAGTTATSVMKLPKAGGTETVLFDGLLNANDVVVDESGVYVSDSNGIHHIPKAGGGVTTLIREPALALAVNPSSVYFVTPTAIRRVTKLGVASLFSIAPQTASVGSPAVLLNIAVWTKPVAGAVISANGIPLVTTGPNPLNATLPASFMTAPGTISITVTNPGFPPSAPAALVVEN